jgi:hypothetical protein
MNKPNSIIAGLLLVLLATLNAQHSTVHAATTIDPFNKYAWGANIG